MDDSIKHSDDINNNMELEDDQTNFNMLGEEDTDFLNGGTDEMNDKIDDEDLFGDDLKDDRELTDINMNIDLGLDIDSTENNNDNTNTNNSNNNMESEELVPRNNDTDIENKDNDNATSLINLPQNNLETVHSKGSLNGLGKVEGSPNNMDDNENAELNDKEKATEGSTTTTEQDSNNNLQTATTNEDMQDTVEPNTTNNENESISETTSKSNTEDTNMGEQTTVDATENTNSGFPDSYNNIEEKSYNMVSNNENNDTYVPETTTGNNNTNNTTENGTDIVDDKEDINPKLPNNFENKPIDEIDKSSEQTSPNEKTDIENNLDHSPNSSTIKQDEEDVDMIQENELDGNKDLFGEDNTSVVEETSSNTIIPKETDRDTIDKDMIVEGNEDNLEQNVNDLGILKDNKEDDEDESVSPEDIANKDMDNNVSNNDLRSEDHVNEIQKPDSPDLRSDTPNLNSEKTKSLEGEIGEKDQNELAFPQSHEIVIPSYSSWFNLNKIHPIERKSLPEFFTNYIPSKTPQVYVKYRNFMVNTYRLNPNEYFTVTSARRNICGDAAAIFRLHRFLMKWGLINYQINPKKIPKNVEPPLTENYQTRHDAPRGLFPFESYKPSVQLPDIAKLKKMMDLDDNESSLSKYLNRTIDKKIVLSQKNTDVTKQDKKTEEEKPEHKKVDAEIKEESNENKKRSLEDDDDDGAEQKEEKTTEHKVKKLRILDEFDGINNKKNEWSKDELKTLLESIHNDELNWYKIAKKVGTKTPEQCILRFLQLPIEDKFLFNGENAGTDIGPLKYAPHLPFSKSENPVLSTVAFLVGLVNPKVVQKMTQRALRDIKEDTHKEKTQEISDDIEKQKEDEKETEEKENEKNDDETKERDEEKDTDNKEEENIIDEVKETESNEKTQDKEENINANKSLLSESSELALSAVGVRAGQFSENEQGELKNIGKEMVETQLKKVALKLKLLDKLEKSFELEKLYLQRQEEDLVLQRLNFIENTKKIQSKFENIVELLKDKDEIKDMVDEIQDMIERPVTLSFGQGSKKYGKNDKENDSDNTLLPVSLEIPQQYHYWSG